MAQPRSTRFAIGILVAVVAAAFAGPAGAQTDPTTTTTSTTTTTLWFPISDAMRVTSAGSAIAASMAAGMSTPLSLYTPPERSLIAVIRQPS